MPESLEGQNEHDKGAQMWHVDICTAEQCSRAWVRRAWFLLQDHVTESRSSLNTSFTIISSEFNPSQSGGMVLFPRHRDQHLNSAQMCQFSSSSQHQVQFLLERSWIFGRNPQMAQSQTQFTKLRMCIWKSWAFTFLSESKSHSIKGCMPEFWNWKGQRSGELAFTQRLLMIEYR